MPAKASPCKDLSGRWANSNIGPAAYSPPIFTVTRSGATIYDIEGVGSGVSLKGTVKLADQTLSLKWNMYPYSEETVYQMDSLCESGNGPMRINKSFLCASTENTVYIRRTKR
ncbi:MAG: hypothetical protein ACI9JM_000513 [Halioglobus sp.]|jgi:hypothetical protein